MTVLTKNTNTIFFGSYGQKKTFGGWMGGSTQKSILTLKLNS